MSGLLNFAGKNIGSQLVVFPDNIAGGSYVPGTLANISPDFITVAVGSVRLNDGPWTPVAPFVAGDVVFIPIRAIDALV